MAGSIGAQTDALGIVKLGIKVKKPAAILLAADCLLEPPTAQNPAIVPAAVGPDRITDHDRGQLPTPVERQEGAVGMEIQLGHDKALRIRDQSETARINRAIPYVPRGITTTGAAA